MKKPLIILKALSGETSYKIVKSLINKELCACEIPSLIKKTQSNTSMHLKKLVMSGILKSRRDGKKILYSIKEKDIIKIVKILEKPNKI